MTRLRIVSALAMGLGLLGLVGCGGDGVKTYPVDGVIEVSGGEVEALAGSTIEAQSESDPAVRASGEIQADGRFSLEILDRGVIRKGAQEGSYKVRIIPADDDPATQKRANKAIAAKFKKFDSSGLTFQVPTTETVKLTVTAK